MPAAALNILPSEQRRFGRYTLLCRLASGGMASLYLARFPGSDGFEKHVAIKKIHQHLTEDGAFVQMFIDEARLAAQIAHPNVAQVLEFGAQPSYFMAMEYVDGESLTALIRRSQPPLPVCARIIAQASAGLHAAHELRDRDGQAMGVVHRDVSPHNILISYDGAVKVVDFGVARARSNIHTTTVGTVKGKFAYMSPEQARMEEVDRRSDIFALGIVLYEMSTRYRLFKAPNEAATVTKVLQADIVPPSVLVPGYPPTLERIVLKALQRDRDARYETAEQLQAALEAFVIEQGSPLLPSAIGQLMRSSFPDRIAEKRSLLQQCDHLGDLAEPELGSSPSLTMGGATVSVAQHEVQQRRRRRRTILAVVGVLALLAFGGLGAFLFEVLSPSTEKPLSATPAAPTSAPVAMVSIEVVAVPAEAKVRVGDKVVANPYRVEQAARVGNERVVVSAVGYRSQTIEVPLSRGGFYSIALQPTGIPAVVVPTPIVDKAEPPKKKPPKRRPKRRRGKRGAGDDDELFGNPYGS